MQYALVIHTSYNLVIDKHSNTSKLSVLQANAKSIQNPSCFLVTDTLACYFADPLLDYAPPTHLHLTPFTCDTSL